MRSLFLLLFVGATGLLAAQDVSAPAPAPLIRLHGTVRAEDGSALRSTAIVRVFDGPETRVDRQGAWTLNAPAGTQTLEARAMGYFPRRISVDVRAETPELKFALRSLQQMLDTMRIFGTIDQSRFASGFEIRHRTGIGRFLTDRDLRRLGVEEIGEALARQPGMIVDRYHVKIRSAFGPGGCVPLFWVDGLPYPSLNRFELENVVDLHRVKGIEIYDEANVPPQFQAAMSGCGSIVIWTR